MDNLLNILFILALIYLINVPIYSVVKGKLLKKSNDKIFRLSLFFKEHVSKYNLNVGCVINAFPDSESFDKNSIKALDLIDDLHFYQKLHNFYLSDEKNTLVLGKCYVLVGVGKDVSINLYKIELRPKK